MDTCFLFVKHLDDKGCFSLKLNEDGELVSPPKQRTFEEILNLQHESRTFIVESCDNATIIELELPWLAERKARVAIPYALEDKLAQSVDELHFSFDKQRYQNNHYLVFVISKNRMHHLLNQLAEHRIDFDLITLDWFALAPQEMCVSELSLLVNHDEFKGALSGELALNYLSKHLLNQPLMFQDSQIVTDLSLSKNEEYSFTWIARALQHTKPLNLCQGEMQHGNNTEWINKGYKLVAVLACLWIVSILGVNALKLHSINKQTAQIDQEIALVYREFFPEAKQVISPKFRIKKLLAENTSENQNHFWFVLNQFAKAAGTSPPTIEHLRYQNKILSVTLVINDFTTLEKLEDQLKKLQLKVKQTQASTHDQHVVATLELT